MIVEITGLAIVLIIGILAYYFYSSRNGKKAVYKSTYAWKIDFLAMLSGFLIVGASYYFYLEGYSLWLLFWLFLSGATQSMLHITKWVVRVKKK